MYRKKPEAIGNILNKVIRDDGIEMPLLQRRIIDAWGDVAGAIVAQQTQKTFIKNQTLFVKIGSPALRAELMLQRTALVAQLNERAGAFVIADIKVY